MTLTQLKYALGLPIESDSDRYLRNAATVGASLAGARVGAGLYTHGLRGGLAGLAASPLDVAVAPLTMPANALYWTNELLSTVPHVGKVFGNPVVSKTVRAVTLPGRKLSDWANNVNWRIMSKITDHQPPRRRSFRKGLASTLAGGALLGGLTYGAMHPLVRDYFRS